VAFLRRAVPVGA
jgi:hypothetical protein